MYTKAFVKIYMGCHYDANHAVDGTLLRYNLQDDSYHESMIDVPLQDTGSSSAISSQSSWIHIVLSVTHSSLVTYKGGVRVADTAYDYFRPVANAQRNNTYPKPSRLNHRMAKLTLRTALYVGGRADGGGRFGFRGSVAGLAIMTSSVNDAVAKCIFLARASRLPDLNAMDAKWTKLKLTHCASAAHPQSFGSSNAAKIACVVHSSCTGVYDPSCDGKPPFYMCKPARFVHSKSSCVYEPHAYDHSDTSAGHKL